MNRLNNNIPFKMAWVFSIRENIPERRTAPNHDKSKFLEPLLFFWHYILYKLGCSLLNDYLDDKIKCLVSVCTHVGPFYIKLILTNENGR